MMNSHSSFGKYSLFIFLFVLLSLPTEELSGQDSQLNIRKKNFEIEKIAKGLHWWQWQGETLFDSPQSINVLSINLKKRKLDILYDGGKMQSTQLFAESVGALAAVNAGFFNTKSGQSVSFLKKDGKVLAQNQADLEEKQSVVIRGAFVVMKDGSIKIESPERATAYANAPEVDDVLFSGPLLIEYLDPIAQDGKPFDQNRHPRTCACLTKSKQLLLLTVDGRNTKAAGTSLPELSELLLELGCEHAINLDGGGSTTMYIKGQNQNGIVNYPSDNKQFDHQGQRKVSNVIVVH